MVIQNLVYLALSILAVLFAKYVHVGIIYINMLYTYGDIFLTPFFSHTNVRHTLLLLCLPLGLAGIPAILYRLIKKKMLPYFFEMTWVFWFVFVLSNLLIR